jgi:hypothetical protein
VLICRAVVVGGQIGSAWRASSCLDVDLELGSGRTHEGGRSARLDLAAASALDA